MKAAFRALVTIALTAVPRAAMACPVCFGESDSPLAKGLNMGVYFLLATVTGVLIAFAAFMIYLARRARVFADDSV
jgi:hypothetical protein